RIKTSPHQGCKQNRKGLLPAHVLNEPDQIVVKVFWRSVAVHFFFGFVIVAELNKDVVAGFDVGQKVGPKPLRDESPGASSILGVIPDLNLLVTIEERLQAFAPAGFRPFGRQFFRHGGIASKMNGDWLLTESPARQQHQNKSCAIPGKRYERSAIPWSLPPWRWCAILREHDFLLLTRRSELPRQSP